MAGTRHWRRQAVVSDQRPHPAATTGPTVPFWLRVAFVLSVFGTLLYFSIVPAPGTGSVSQGPFGVIPYSMWLHVVGYMGFAIVLGYASDPLEVPQSQLLFGVFVFTVGCGVAVELLQYTLPTRTFSVLDMLVNAVGAAIGVTLWYLFSRLRESGRRVQ